MTIWIEHSTHFRLGLALQFLFKLSDLGDFLVHRLDLFFDDGFGFGHDCLLRFILWWISLCQVALGKSLLVSFVFFFGYVKLLLCCFDQSFLAFDVLADFVFALLAWDEACYWDLLRRRSSMWYLPAQLLLLTQHFLDFAYLSFQLLHLCCWWCSCGVGCMVVILVLEVWRWLLLSLWWRILQKMLVFSLGLANLNILSGNLISELLNSGVVFVSSTISTRRNPIRIELNIQLINLSFQLSVFVFLFFFLKLQRINLICKLILLLNLLINLSLKLSFVTCSQIKVINWVLNLIKLLLFFFFPLPSFLLVLLLHFLSELLHLILLLLIDS